VYVAPVGMLCAFPCIRMELKLDADVNIGSGTLSFPCIRMELKPNWTYQDGDGNDTFPCIRMELKQQTLTVLLR